MEAIRFENKLKIVDVRVRETNVDIALLADFFEGAQVPDYIKGYIAAQEMPGAPAGGIVDALISEAVAKATHNALAYDASVSIIPEDHMPVVLARLQDELDARVLDRLVEKTYAAFDALPTVQTGFTEPVAPAQPEPARFDEADNFGCTAFEERPAAEPLPEGFLAIDAGSDALLRELFGDPANADFRGIRR